MSREWRLYLRDAITFCERILDYARGMSREQLEADQRTYDAVARNIELLGEAVKNLPQEVRERHPHVPWVKIIATRNIIAHVYFGIDEDVVWDIVSNKCESLLAQLRRIEAGIDEERD